MLLPLRKSKGPSFHSIRCAEYVCCVVLLSLSFSVENIYVCMYVYVQWINKGPSCPMIRSARCGLRCCRVSFCFVLFSQCPCLTVYMYEWSRCDAIFVGLVNEMLRPLPSETKRPSRVTYRCNAHGVGAVSVWCVFWSFLCVWFSRWVGEWVMPASGWMNDLISILSRSDAMRFDSILLVWLIAEMLRPLSFFYHRI